MPLLLCRREMPCTEKHHPIDRIAHHEPVEVGGGNSVDGRVMVNNPDLVVRAAVDGLGIAYTIGRLTWNRSCARGGIVMSGRAPADQGLFFGVALVASAVMSSAFFCGDRIRWP